MNLDSGGQAVIYLLLLILPISALIARRVPVLRVVLSLVSWAVIAGLLLVVITERERFDPYLQYVTRLLKLDDQNVVGEETRIRMSADGHFWAKVTIDGVNRRMLVDSGATLTALSTDTAAAASLDVRDSLIPIVLNTANGRIQARSATVRDLKLGDIVARDLPVVVSPAFGDTDVLGMNFLSKLKSWRVEGNTLILVPHHHQEFT
ncbi:peptidase [Sphingomonas melonis TY]|jgi:aspartyl protease family protein|uniref:Peptidase n=1 Tax=Sphingomonas melonis TY TaxID=621456 RepID=A0A154NBG6_9SPHN|nr:MULTISPECIES: TIGR02281 family clan AA aspartic protease [Sphingomonas]ANC88093.1 peptidase [Sphingomonas sp. NIC1]AOW23592.1 peptidase [Sphingomonas melonis TY]ATI54589.1 TIGR02281 family clan AA aspartic protease [Sphingomonas melonis]KZB97025.1 peptidase [Sphingomonas melonis TY]MBI0531059.1 TIGR02281 family clan AA aspartic protease [Sphingomonas sp. TX0522]